MMQEAEQAYNMYRKEVAAATKERDEAEGAEKQLLKQLEEEFGTTNIEDAEAQLNALIRKKELAEESFCSIMTEIETNFPLGG